MKQWEELTFSDDYMFKLVLRNEDLCTGFIERIMRCPVAKISYINEEKVLQPNYDGKGVRVDVYVGNSDEVFDLEMQMWNSGLLMLAKRSRYYQAAMDIDMLKRGDSYTKLKHSYIVFICPFDIFEQGRHLYTFKNFCQEDKNLSLNDERAIMFLNTHGTMNDVPSELLALCDYINGKYTDDALVRKIDDEIKHVKSMQKERMSYMTYAMKLEDMRAMGRAEGINLGRAEGRLEVLLTSIKNLMNNVGFSLEQAINVVGANDEEKARCLAALNAQK